MIYLLISLPVSIVALYGLTLYFKDKEKARAYSHKQTEDLLCRLELLTVSLEELKKRTANFESRYDAVTKTFLESIMEMVKFQKKENQATQAKAYTASR